MGTYAWHWSEVWLTIDFWAVHKTLAKQADDNKKATILVL